MSTPTTVTLAPVANTTTTTVTKTPITSSTTEKCHVETIEGLKQISRNILEFFGYYTKILVCISIYPYTQAFDTLYGFAKDVVGVRKLITLQIQSLILEKELTIRMLHAVNSDSQLVQKLAKSVNKITSLPHNIMRKMFNPFGVSMIQNAMNDMETDDSGHVSPSDQDSTKGRVSEEGTQPKTPTTKSGY